MAKPLNVLIVEDWPEDAELMLAELRRAGFEPVWKRVETETAFLAELKNQPDIIISDYSLPQFNGLRAVELLTRSGLNIPFILVSGTVGEDAAVEAMRLGATDYLLKDRIARLGHAVDRALEQQRLRKERQQFEESLKLFRALIDRSNEGIEVIDPDSGRLLDVNETTCTRLGYRRQELLKLTVLDITEGMDAAAWSRVCLTMREIGFQTIETRQRRKDGSTFPAEVSVRHVKLDREYLIAAVRDITERKRAEKELQESQALYQSLVSQMAAGIFRKDRSGRFVLVNPWFCELRGLPADQILGRTSDDLVAMEMATHSQIQPDTLRLLREGQQHFEQILRTGERIQVEETHPGADGGKRHLHVVKSAVFGPDGQITGVQGVQFDVTNLKQAEASLKLFRALIDRSNEGIEVIDPETSRFLDVNETTCQRLGYTRAELMTMGVPDIDPHINLSAWPQIVTEVRQRGSKTMEGQHRRKDVSTYPIEVSVRYVQLDRDYLIAAVRDITERKRAEDALRASEARLRLVTDNARVGLVMVDARHCYTFNNATYAEILGLPSTDLVGRRVAEVLAPLYEEQIRPQLELAFNRERVAYELQRRLPDGEHYYAVRYEPMESAGTVSMVIVVITEITERRRAEEARRASEGRYRTLFQYAPDGILIADSQSYYLDANVTICRMLGYTRDDLIGMHGSDIVAPEEIRNIEPALELIKAKTDYNREWRFRRQDGSVFTAEVIATLMPDGNLLAMIRDVTERKRAEAEIQDQLNELQRWHEAMLNREDRILELKREVNELLAARQLAPRYPEADSP
jgi:PAS domain S-box-containing protein